MQKDSPQSGAPLTRCSDGRENGALNKHLQISVWHDDGGIVASQFQQTLSESVLNGARDLSADFGASSEGD